MQIDSNPLNIHEDITVNVVDAFQKAAAKEADGDLNASKLHTLSQEMFNQYIVPALKQRGASDIDYRNAQLQWSGKTQKIMQSHGLLPKDGQSSRSFAKDRNTAIAINQSVKTGSKIPLIKDAISSVGQSIGNAFGQGTGSLIESGARFFNDIGDNTKGTALDRIANYGASLRRGYESSASTEQKKIQSGQNGKAQQLALGMVQSTPAMALPFGAAKVVGGVASKIPAIAKVAPYMGLGAGVVAGHTQNYGEVRRQSLQNLQKDFPTWESLQDNPHFQENLNAALNQGLSFDEARNFAHEKTLDDISEGASDKYGTLMTALDFIAPSGAALGSGILKKNINSKIAKTLVGEPAKKLVAKELQNAPRFGISKFVDVNPIANAAAAKMVVRQGLEEGVQGAIGEYGSQQASAAIGGKPVDWGQVGQSFVDEGIMGALMGSGMQSASKDTPMHVAKEVATDLRNRTNLLRREEAQARTELSEAIQLGNKDSIASANENLSNINTAAHAIQKEYQKYDVKPPHFIEKLTKQNQSEVNTPKPNSEEFSFNRAQNQEQNQKQEQFNKVYGGDQTPIIKDQAINPNMYYEDGKPVEGPILNQEKLSGILDNQHKQEQFNKVYGGDQAPIIKDQVINPSMYYEDGQPVDNPIINQEKLNGILDDQQNFEQNAQQRASNSELNESQNGLTKQSPDISIENNRLIDQKPSLTSIVSKHLPQEQEPIMNDFGFDFSHENQNLPDDGFISSFDDNQPRSVTQSNSYNKKTGQNTTTNENGEVYTDPIQNVKFFESNNKAKNFIKDNELKATHEVVQAPHGGFKVQPKEIQNSPNEEPYTLNLDGQNSEITEQTTTQEPEQVATIEQSVTSNTAPESESEKISTEQGNNPIAPEQQPPINNEGQETASSNPIKSFSNQSKAKDYLTKNNLEDTHSISAVDGLFEVHPNVEQELQPQSEPSFAQAFQDAHINNPSIKPKLINDEIAKGRPRAEVLKEASTIVSNSSIQSANNVAAIENLVSDQKPIKNNDSKINGGDIGRNSENEPFLNKNSAKGALKSKNIEESHEVVEIAPSKYVLREIKENGRNFPLKKVEKAFSHAHLSPKNTAISMKSDFDKFIQDQVNEADAIVETPEQQKALDDAISFLEDQYINEWLPPLLNAASNTVSSSVAGRSNFNKKQADKSGSALDEAISKFSEKAGLYNKYAYREVLSARNKDQVDRDHSKSKQEEVKQNQENIEKTLEVAKKIEKSSSPKARPSNKNIDNPESAKKMTMDEWKKTSKDYKSVIDGVRHTLALVDGKTSLVPVWINDEGQSKATEIKASEVDRPAPDKSFEDIKKSYYSVYDRINNGDESLKIEEVKNAYQDLMGKYDELEAEYSSQTKKDLLATIHPYYQAMYKSRNKPEIVKSLVENEYKKYLFLSDGVLTISYGDKRSVPQIIGDLIKNATQDQLDKFNEKQRAENEKRKEDIQTKIDGLSDPKTLDDFERIYRTGEHSSFIDFYRDLPENQQALYDELKSQSLANARLLRSEQDKATKKYNAASTEVQTTQDATLYEGKHTKKGHDIWTVSLNGRIESDVFNDLRSQAKDLGGYYSSYRGNGAIAGFVFENKANASEFLGQINEGNPQTQEITEKTSQNDVDIVETDSQKHADKLISKAQAVIDRGQESLNRDRKSNTHKRAADAARAEDQANKEILLGETLIKIAEGIVDGKVKYLSRLNAFTQLKDIESILQRASYEQKNLTKATEREVNLSTIGYAEFPQYKTFTDHFKDALKDLRAIKPSLAKRLETAIEARQNQAYQKWLNKENENGIGNYLSVTAIQKDGTPAIFKISIDRATKIVKQINAKQDKDTFELFKVKNGEYAIISTHESAVEGGKWYPTRDDQMITLSNELGQEIYSSLKSHQAIDPKYSINWQIEHIHNAASRMDKLGIHDPASFRAMLREYLSLRSNEKGKDPIKELERTMIGRSNDGLDFFPTPKKVVEQMIDLSDLKPDMKVLEPSAGMGHIADILKDYGVKPDVIEISGKRRELLELKGYNTVAQDFLEFMPKESEKYDRIVMNPPFSDRRDAQHIYHAYDLLKDDGVLVAIAGEGVFSGNDAKAKQFQHWLDETNAQITELDAGTFNDPNLPVTTGVKARIVTIHKSESKDKKFSRSDDLTASPEEISGSTIENIESTLNQRFGSNIVQSLKNQGILNIIPTYTEKGVEGFAENGKVTLVADHLTADNIIPVFLHELGGHIGFQGLLSDKAYETLTSEFDRLVKNNDPLALEAKRLAEREQGEDVQKDEYLPYLVTVAAQAKSKNLTQSKSLVNRILSAVKAWAVHKLGLNLKLTPDDILALSERMIKSIEKKQLPSNEFFKVDQTEANRIGKEIDRLNESLQSYPDPVKMKMPKALLALDGVKSGLNIKDLPLELDRFTLRKITGQVDGKKDVSHQLTLDQIKQLPHELADPVAVLQSDDGRNVVVVTTLRDKNNNQVISAIHLNKQRNKYVINELATTFGRERFDTWISKRKDQIIYLNNEKSLANSTLPHFLWNEPNQTNMGVVDSKASMRDRLLTPQTIVNRFNNLPKSRRYSFNSNPETMSRTKQREFFERASQSAVGQNAISAIEKVKTGSKRTTSLFNTMMHKALSDETGEFKKTFDLVQDKINHVTFASSTSMDVAPNILTQLETWGDFKKEAKRVGKQIINKKAKIDDDLEKVGNLMFENTLLEESKVHTDSELRKLGFDQDQIDLYREARKAINTSLDTFAKTTISNIYKHMGGTTEEILSLTAQDLSLKDHIEQIKKHIDDIVEDVPEKEDSAQYAISSIEKVAGKLAALKEQGYVPLMRFGKYYIRVVNPESGSVAYRQHFESESERNIFFNNYDQSKIPVGYVLEKNQNNPLENKLFQGVSPETVALFAKEAGLPVGDAEKAYIQLSLRDNHALKRLLKRQGIDGFDKDFKRVLAAFVLSNSRYSANQIYNPAIDESIAGISTASYQEDAIRLRDYALDTQEELAGLKNFSFVWYMGFSAMFGVVNLTQPIIQTLPYLLQYGKDWTVIGTAFKNAIQTWRKGVDVMPEKYKAHYELAKRQGHLDPQNTWMLQGLERGKSGLGANTWQLFSHSAGFFAQASETVNRRTSLFAALDVAESLGQEKLKKLGFKDAYDFAVRTIQETQGIYNKGNRPRVARGNVGSMLMMYKQFMIAYVEQMVRMQKSGLWGGEDDEFKRRMAQLVGFGVSKSVLIALGLLWSFSGTTGLPFMRDLLDVVETAGGMVGKPFNTEREVQMALHKALGDTVGTAANTALMDGIFNLNPIVDFKGRMGMGDLIPATGYFSPLTSDYQKSNESSQVLGAMGGLTDKIKESVEFARIGSYGQSAIQLLPKALTSVGQGAIAATTGDYRNMKTGVKTSDATIVDGIVKMLDAQPASIAKEGRYRGMEMKDKAALQFVNKSWRERYNDALESGKPEKLKEIKKEIKDYNAEDPKYPINFNQKRAETNFKKSNQSWQEKHKTTRGLEWMSEENPYL